MKLFPSISKDQIELPQAFPMKISQTAGVSPTFQRLHWHTALEMNYIQKGSGYYLINGARYDFRQGDLILINSNDLHRAFEAEDLVMTIVMFDPAYLALEQRYDPELLVPFREMGQRFDNVLDRRHPEHTRLAEIIIQMAAEFERKEPHFEMVIRAQLIQFLAYVNRYFAKNKAGWPQHARGMETIRGVLAAIEANIAYPWTLRELAEAAHLSPSRFSALFVQAVGTSPMDYLIQLRLSQAAHLLESTDHKIIEVAGECGFRNLSNFNRLFKQHIGKLPSELRS
ncbi:AraC family transcriptional regulator [Paenibacillus alkaliterrae]|uniref:AraC family transcriptional regulator n=1 Tax=Paenibacillus alkaliterrae TaxID=320909 RepID=UPI001F3DFB94|nr:AraC family transcriptional regulator [Paenibacillus alkaliterrae]MCF2940532.1 AraC family transcriptional regulator [Paenibacillus alkaliterrae]